jgi:methanogenic corrinoid protein MtbC1
MAELNEDALLAEVRALVEQKVPPLEIIADLQAGITIVGKRFEAGEYFLAELIAAASLFTEVTKMLGMDVDADAGAGKGTFVIGTIYGDIHDIGKNLVVSLMKSNGFRVVDLGVDVPTEKFLAAIREHKPQVVGISGLLTTVYDHMKECIQAIEQAGLRKDLKIIIGGAAVNESVREYVKADAVCLTAQQGVDYCKRLLGVN